MKFLTFSLFLALVNRGLGVPIIDISPLYSVQDVNQRRHAVMAQIDEALTSVGFFIATNHSINFTRYNQTKKTAEDLFAIDIETKQKIEIKTGGFMRGYIGFGKESGLDALFEPKEGFSYGFPWNGSYLQGEKNKLQGENIWPDFNATNKKLKYDLLDTFFDCVNISLLITNSIKEVFYSKTGLNLSIDTDGGDTISIMRLFHYFSAENTEKLLKDNSKKLIGSSPHTDWGLLTVIIPDYNMGGLQFLNTNGTWENIDINLPKGAVIVNGGDFLNIISNNRYKSPIHRVLSPKKKNRISYVFFFYPNFNTPMNFEINSNCETNEEKKKEQTEDFNTLISEEINVCNSDYPLVFGDYIMKKWEKVFNNGKK